MNEVRLRTWYNRIYSDEESESYFRSYQTFFSLIDYLGASPGDMLLDVGAGDGRLLRAASERKLIAFSIDISEIAVAKAASFAPDALVTVGNGENLCFSDSSFDYITCIGSLEHFIDIEAGLNEMARVAKSDAKLCIVVPNSFYLFDIIEVLKTGCCRSGTFQPQEKLASRGEWEELLGKHGLSVLAVYRDKASIDTSWHKIFADFHPIRTFNRVVERILQSYMPLNLGYQFIFICQKSRQ